LHGVDVGAWGRGSTDGLYRRKEALVVIVCVCVYVYICVYIY
jgi:hypothetical protein